MPKLKRETLKQRIAILKRIRENNEKIIESLLKETKAKDEKILWYRKKLKVM